MDTFLIVLAGVFLIIGLIGCFFSKLPGTLLSYLGIIILHYTSIDEFSVHFFIRWGVLVIAVQGLDYFIPNWGNRKFGGSIRGVCGSMLGVLSGLFFGSWEIIIIGAIVGAFIGELFAGKESNKAIRYAFASFAFFILGTISQLIVAGILFHYYLNDLSYLL
ncbi:MAG: DUF456 domain-containing protein [Bacteroidota bacterium]|nr:DUF456 domain-containing protein [Bacteroidota bacterium]